MNKSLDYLAGIIDGEGYIGVHRRKATTTKSPSYWIRVAIGMKNSLFIHRLAQEFGGHVRRCKSGVTYVTWDCDGAADLLVRVVDHLVVKQQTARMTLEFYQRQRELRAIRPPKTTRTGRASLTGTEIVELDTRFEAIKSVVHAAYN